MLATGAVLLVVASLIARVLTAGPVSMALFEEAPAAALYTGMIAGGFAVDRRKRRNHLRGL